MSDKFSKPKFKNSWQVLSAQSAKVTSCFLAIIFFNFCMVWLNMRVPLVLDRAVWGQIFWVIVLGCSLGALELLTKRQELVATFPFSRNKIFLNRLFYAIVAIITTFLLNFSLDSGLAELALYDEVWLQNSPLKVTLLNSLTLLLAFICSFSMAVVARTLTGVVLSLLGVWMFFIPVIFTRLSLVSNSFIGCFSVVAILLFIGAIWDNRKVDKVKQGIVSITNIRLVSLLYWSSLVIFFVLTIFNV